MSDVAIFGAEGSDAPVFEVDELEEDSLVVDDPGVVVEEGLTPGGRWRRVVTAAGVAVLISGVAVSSLGWNSANSRADRLAARLTGTRAELAKQQLEASNLRSEVSNLHADKNVLNIHIAELEGERDDLQLDNDDLSSTNEAISSVVRQLEQCLTGAREIGRQLLRNPQALSEERTRAASLQCATAQAAAAALKAVTKPADGKAV